MKNTLDRPEYKLTSDVADALFPESRVEQRKETQRQIAQRIRMRMGNTDFCEFMLAEMKQKLKQSTV